MKPIYLELCGINSFSEPAKINFSKLLEFGIFGIFGDTGSGKSTVLDCIGFALYGDVARSRSGVIGDVINYRQDVAYVHFEFEIYFEGKRRAFRVERELKRKKEGTEQSLSVYESEDGKWIACADSVRDGNALLKRIVGLEQRDFEKCIALPQGEFAQFVKAVRGERLRIVSRLFDLERFGESLVKRANARSLALLGEVQLLSARLEPYQEITAEGNAALGEEILRLEGEETAAENALLSLREREKALSLLAEQKREFERVSAEMEKLESEKTAMKQLNDELSRIERANVCVEAMKRCVRAEEIASRLQSALSAANARLNRAEKALRTLPTFDEESADAEIARLVGEKTRAEEAEKIRLRRAELLRELERGREKVRSLSAKLGAFDYDKEKRAIEERLEELGAGDFLAFLEGQGREALLRGEYEKFAAELKALEEKYPFISPDTAPLIERYLASSEGDRVDFSALKEAFEAREKARTAANEALIALENTQTNYLLRCKEIENIQNEIGRAERELAACEEQLFGVPDLQNTAKVLEGKMREKRVALESRKRAGEEQSAAALTQAQAQAEFSAAQQTVETERARLLEELSAGGFESAEQARVLVEKYGDAKGARERVDTYREEYAATRKLLRKLSETDYSALTEGALLETRAALASAERVKSENTKLLAIKRRELEEKREKLVKKNELSAELTVKKREANVAERLKSLLKDNKFMEFVAEEYLQTVAVNASSRLLSLTDGRYFLRYRTKEGFSVGDNFNGGNLRGVYTLSGGETFLVSLSLALALSNEICTKSARPIEFFFLDEGFGTLDERLVDIVMDSLEKLKSESFSIGIISHVEELKHRIGRKLIVEKATERHGSQIHAE